MAGFVDVCRPAGVYFLISTFALAIMATQNVGNNYIYCVGNYYCSVSSVLLIFAVKFIYIIGWTYILNAICQYGYEKVSWFLVLIPYILLFIFIGLFIAVN